MSFLRFDNTTNINDITHADAVYLDLKIRSVESNINGGKINVYGLTDSYMYYGMSYDCKTDWTEGTITGTVAKANKMAVFSDNCLSYDILSTAKEGTQIRIDVTDYARMQNDGIYAFKLSSEGAEAGNPLNLTLYSKESIYAPKLTVVKSLAAADILEDIEENKLPGSVTENFALPAYGTHASEITWDIENSAVTRDSGIAKVTRNITDTLGSATVYAKKFERCISKTYYFAVTGTEPGGMPHGIRFENKENEVKVTAYVYADKITPDTRLIMCENITDSGKIAAISFVSGYDVRNGIGKFSGSMQSMVGEGRKIHAYLIDIVTMMPKLVCGAN